MQIKRVKVTKAYHKDYWYADRIGDEFYVFNVGSINDPDDRFCHQVVTTGTFEKKPLPHRFLDNEDFEVIEVFDAKIIEQITISIQRKESSDVTINRNRIFPEPKESGKKSGWKISLDFLHKIQTLYDDKAERDGFNREAVCYPSPEEIESILLLAEEAMNVN